MANNHQPEAKTMAVSMLAEGNSIRSVELMTGIHRDTVMRLAGCVGGGCAKILDEKVRGLSCKNVEVDKIWWLYRQKEQEHHTCRACYRIRGCLAVHRPGCRHEVDPDL